MFLSLLGPCYQTTLEAGSAELLRAEAGMVQKGMLSGWAVPRVFEHNARKGMEARSIERRQDISWDCHLSLNICFSQSVIHVIC